MSKFLVGVDGVSHKVEKMLIGVDGVARNVRAAYIGVDGQAKLFFGGYYKPTENEVLVRLNIGEYYNADTVFPAGIYRVDIYEGHVPSSTNPTVGFYRELRVSEPFQIFAFVSSNALTSFITNLGVDGVGTIFGGRGGKSAGITVPSDSVKPFSAGVLNPGGSVCHFIPRNGTFGTDYLHCFQIAPRGSAYYGGSGAYGGGAGGRGSRAYAVSGQYLNSTGQTGIAGAGGAGGAGGTGTTNGQTGNGWNGRAGSSGSGSGYGTALNGGAAEYGSGAWVRKTTTNATSVDSYIKVTYLRQNW